MAKKIPAIAVVLLILGTGIYFFNKLTVNKIIHLTDMPNLQDEGVLFSHELTIFNLRAGNYPGSEIKMEEKLEPGSNYDRYLTSYQSESYKIYALLTIPKV